VKETVHSFFCLFYLFSAKQEQNQTKFLLFQSKVVLFALRSQEGLHNKAPCSELGSLKPNNK